MQPAEAVAPRVNLEEGMNLAVHHKTIAEDPVNNEQVEEQPAFFVECLVGENHRHIEFRKTGEMETRRFISSVELIEKKIEADEPLIRVLRREVHAVVVIPERA